MKLNKKELQWLLKVGQKMNLDEILVSDSSIQVKFGKANVWNKNSKQRLSKSEQEKLDKIHAQAEVDEMMIMDPAAYEDRLSRGELVEVDSEFRDSSEAQ